MVCQVCSNALELGWEKGLARVSGTSMATLESNYCIAHHENLNSLATSASEACRICLRLWDSIGDEAKQKIGSEDAKQAHIEMKDKGGHCDDYYATYFNFSSASNLKELKGVNCVASLSVVVNSWALGERQKAIEIWFYLSRRKERLQHLQSRRLQSHSTSSAEALAQASEWVERCATTHSSCKSALKPDWYPTRLLDLGDKGACGNDVRLVIPANVCPVGPYVTLSHCWGSANFIKLQKSTMDQFQQAIPIIDMPATFRDAIKVARYLGVRYLWIDSLCILQDENDTSDWLNEASLMRKVYAGSYCNISALAAHDSSEGLFFERDPRLSDTHVKLRVKEMGFQEEYLDCDVVERFFWKDHVSDCFINKRAWVLQERMLPPRVLHFGREQLFWECREQDAAEVFPDGLPGFLELAYFTNFKNLDLTTRNKELRKGGTWHMYNSVSGYHELWHILVFAYSTAKMTKPSDKLIALSGLAKEFAELTQDTYVVGMWRKFLASELLWRVVDTESDYSHSSPRPTIYRAPSFSWASIDDAVVFSEATESNLLVEVVDVQLKYVTGDITGLVNEGFLDIRGQLKPVKILAQSLNSQRVYFLESEGVIIRAPTRARWQDLEVLIDVDPKGFEKENADQSLYYMPVANGIQPYTAYLQLLVFEVASREQGTFRRIGLARSKDEENINKLLRVSHNPEALPCREYHNGLHTIRLI